MAAGMAAVLTVCGWAWWLENAGCVTSARVRTGDEKQQGSVNWPGHCVLFEGSGDWQEEAKYVVNERLVSQESR